MVYPSPSAQHRNKCTSRTTEGMCRTAAVIAQHYTRGMSPLEVILEGGEELLSCNIEGDRVEGQPGSIVPKGKTAPEGLYLYWWPALRPST